MQDNELKTELEEELEIVCSFCNDRNNIKKITQDEEAVVCVGVRLINNSPKACIIVHNNSQSINNNIVICDTIVPIIQE